MGELERLQEKRVEVLKVIEPICKAFDIKDYDYIVKETGQRETLRVGDIKVGCSCNSISAVVDELIGCIFIQKWCKNRSLGAFETQTKNVIKRYWIKEGSGE